MNLLIDQSLKCVVRNVQTDLAHALAGLGSFRRMGKMVAVGGIDTTIGPSVEDGQQWALAVATGIVFMDCKVNLGARSEQLS
jgi:hypothetical protein